MVVFGQKSLCLGKWFYSGKVVVFVQKWLYWAKWLYSGKVLVFWQSGCNPTKVFVFGQERLCSGKSGCIRAMWLPRS